MDDARDHRDSPEKATTAGKISALKGLDPNYGVWGTAAAHRVNDPLLLEALASFLNSDNARQQKISAMVLTTYGETRAKDPLFNHLNEQLVDDHPNQWTALFGKSADVEASGAVCMIRALWMELTPLCATRTG